MVLNAVSLILLSKTRCINLHCKLLKIRPLNIQRSGNHEQTICHTVENIKAKNRPIISFMFALFVFNLITRTKRFLIVRRLLYLPSTCYSHSGGRTIIQTASIRIDLTFNLPIRLCVSYQYKRSPRWKPLGSYYPPLPLCC